MPVAATIALCSGVSACGSTTTSSVTSPSTSKCQVALNAGSMSFPSQGGNGSVSVSTSRECSWSAEATSGWIRLAATGGQGEATIPFSIDANTSYSDRSGAIRVSNAGEVSVRQDAAPPPPPPPPPPDSGPAPPPPPSDGPIDPDTGRTVDIDGEVSGLAGSCPAVTFTVSGRLVRTSALTEFKKMDCGALRNGLDVEVRGVVQADGSILATRIERD